MKEKFVFKRDDNFFKYKIFSKKLITLFFQKQQMRTTFIFLTNIKQNNS